MSCEGCQKRKVEIKKKELSDMKNKNINYMNIPELLEHYREIERLKEEIERLES